jgi:hypothetical protein
MDKTPVGQGAPGVVKRASPVGLRPRVQAGILQALEIGAPDDLEP